jgi:hypothetical protein
MNKCVEIDLYIHFVLISALLGFGWLAPRTGRFTSGERASGIHRIRGRVDPRECPGQKILDFTGIRTSLPWLPRFRIVLQFQMQFHSTKLIILKNFSEQILLKTLDKETEKHLMRCLVT